MTATQQQQAPNILIVDDTPANLLLLVRMLRSGVQAADGSQRETGAAGRPRRTAGPDSARHHHAGK